MAGSVWNHSIKDSHAHRASRVLAPLCLHQRVRSVAQPNCARTFSSVCTRGLFESASQRALTRRGAQGAAAQAGAAAASDICAHCRERGRSIREAARPRGHIRRALAYRAAKAAARRGAAKARWPRQRRRSRLKTFGGRALSSNSPIAKSAAA